MISPTLLFHLFTHNYQTANESLPLSLSLSTGIVKTIITANSVDFTTARHKLHVCSHTVDIDSHPEPGRLGLEDRDCRDGWAYAFQAAGHHQLGAEEPPFPASR